jgi:phage-related baseplate assembly protein
MALNLNDLPDINFAEKDINKILSDMILGYEKAYFEETGEIKTLHPGDPIRVFLYSQALREFQLRVLIDDSAKQNLLKYARGDRLDHLGSFYRITRLEPTASKVTVRFNLSQSQPTDAIIPAGTRVSPGGEIYFSVMEDITVPAGSTQAQFLTKCTQRGKIGNGFTSGQINILIDPLPWIGSVENLEVSSGGADWEDDESFRERIHLSLESFSVAGPTGAYEYFARQYSALIEDIRVSTPSPGVVDIRVLLIDGQIPNSTFLSGLNTHLSAKDRRPLTDLVQTSAPDIINYDITLTYYINIEDANSEELIKTKVEKAIEEYKIWQRSRIGRDLNPSELNFKIREAGAKRAVITTPIYQEIQPYQIANENLISITYGGLEED